MIMKDNKQTGISVIMPVYKVEKYIAKAIESILNQSFSDFEFINYDEFLRTFENFLKRKNSNIF